MAEVEVEGVAALRSATCFFRSWFSARRALAASLSVFIALKCASISSFSWASCDATFVCSSALRLAFSSCLRVDSIAAALYELGGRLFSLT